ncbi:hypothetical protein CEXT_642651 [Caerostris extrusa]|uniref:Uncharacterized protein n=1 Tax=Caerostris extrusa TaxID=172846 RepID=A0AAV4REQ2_CAEEX|nr:hypothetical protein CEXT_642651 [Caerostris extrusa]
MACYTDIPNPINHYTESPSHQIYLLFDIKRGDTKRIKIPGLSARNICNDIHTESTLETPRTKTKKHLSSRKQATPTAITAVIAQKPFRKTPFLHSLGTSLPTDPTV